MLNAKTRIGAELEKLRFYEWAYGCLTESDSDIGVVGEYMVGRLLGCLGGPRRAQAAFDLVAKDGTTIEVKTTSRRKRMPNGTTLLYWEIADQRTALDGKRPLADIWIFLHADFPPGRARVNALDVRWWRAWVATGEQVRAAGTKRSVTETTLKRMGVASVPFADLRAALYGPADDHHSRAGGRRATQLHGRRYALRVRSWEARGSELAMEADTGTGWNCHLPHSQHGNTRNTAHPGRSVARVPVLRVLKFEN